MAELDSLRLLLAYLRARLGEGRSEAGIITMEVLAWSLGALIVGGAIVALVYYGWYNDAKQVQHTPQPVAPAG